MAQRKGRRQRRSGDAMRACLYLRVSTSEQAHSGLGLAAQESSLRAECDRRGWTVVELLVDAGASGKSLGGRPALTTALAMLDADEADILMVAKLDRLSRSLLDFAALIERAQRDGWNIVALDLGIDLSTPAGEFLASVMASAAQWERKIIGQRTRDALAAKRAQGVRLGRPIVVSTEVRARIRADRERGDSYRQIAQALNDDRTPTAHGGRQWYPATVRSVLLSN